MVLLHPQYIACKNHEDYPKAIRQQQMKQLHPDRRQKCQIYKTTNNLECNQNVHPHQHFLCQRMQVAAVQPVAIGEKIGTNKDCDDRMPDTQLNEEMCCGVKVLQDAFC